MNIKIYIVEIKNVFINFELQTSNSWNFQRKSLQLLSFLEV